MNRINLVAAVALALIVSGAAQAKGVVHTKTVTVSKSVVSGRPGPAVKVVAPAVYYRTHGIRFPGGYYYSGFNHHHWSAR
jgi:hypothetical protein